MIRSVPQSTRQMGMKGGRFHRKAQFRNFGGVLVEALMNACLANACEKIIVLDALVKIESFTESKRFNYLTQGVKQFKYSNTESSVTGQRTSDFTKRVL